MGMMASPKERRHSADFCLGSSTSDQFLDLIMKPHTLRILGFKLDSGGYSAAEVSHLLINAPLKVDAGRIVPTVRSDLCRLMDWPPGSRRGVKKRIDRLLGEIDAAVTDSLRRVAEGDLDGAADRLSGYRELWVGVFGIAQAPAVIEQLQAYQRKHRIADGYDGAVVSPEVAYLKVWHDR